jgi:phosphatidylglycerophosphate synthase
VEVHTSAYALKATAAFAAIAAVVVFRRRAFHPFDRFGLANQVTLTRALLVALAAGLIGEARVPALAAAAAGLGLAATALDGVDGWLARRTGMTSAFGARFDMEVDALLIQVLALLVWQHGKAGVWVIAAGLLRYLFVAAGWVWPWLRQPLAPSTRGKVICVVQIAGLVFALLPMVRQPYSAWIAAASLAALTYSFVVDIAWLFRHRHAESNASGPAWRHGAALVIAIGVLNAAATFENVWPTPAIWWTGGVSIELAVCVLLLIAAGARVNRPSIAALLAAAWVLLALGRYAQVTAPALYGRDVNLYWDLRFIPDVAAMVTRVAPTWLVLAATAIVVFAIWLLYRAFAWAFRRLLDAIAEPNGRIRVAGAALTAVALFAAQSLGAFRGVVLLPEPVVRTYAHQIALVMDAHSGSRSLPPSPDMESSLARVDGADIFLVFVESYGAIAYDPAVTPALTASRAQLAADIRDGGRQVVSAFVESPTFGGSSWLAHLSLLSGIEVRDPDTNARLMTQQRPTLVQTFARHGFRTIGLMPGLRQKWPEGAFYGFQEIYGADTLAYVGPEFGWFALPDQFSLAKFDALEASRPAGPRFVFFPTISTHFPFSPTPPYQPDWTRMLVPKPYDGPSIVRAYARQPDWTHFLPGYTESLAYDFAVLGGYLRRHADRDLVMIIIGDHQPPALVTGEHASWDVPVHVVTSRAALAGQLEAIGFRRGLEPARPALARMHALTPILLDAFGGHE